ncbi:MAG: peptidoglycan DD-metalloendopeptidase family protein, partial [Clostridia bacterium]|nr:peptidoglycan DD-metalloendopeptidase family protein [Clostridia bacterium]
SQDFSTLLTRTELLVRVAEHDNNLMATLESDIKILEELETTLTTSVSEQEVKADQLDKQSTVLANKKADAQSASAELEEKKAEIQVQYDQAKDELNQLDKESDEYIARIKKQEEQLLELSAEMEEFIKNNGSSTSDPDEEEVSEESVSGEENEDKETEVEKPSNPAKGMMFPLKTKGVYISSPYGMRTHPITGEYKMHSGVDFSAPNGTINKEPIYAAQAGEVIFAGTRGGYGNYIIVDHGKGITTCYAHCSSIGVTTGQQVKQGQVIGKVGDTGSSTAPHLHFEVRIDGATTQPMNYVSLPG